VLVSSGVYRVQVTTGGASYSTPPAVSLTGGGGTGAAAVAQMAGTVVSGVVITNAGSGYTSAPTVAITAASTATGTGAAATASVIALTTPACLFQGRFNDMYGIDGKGRGFRWDGETPTLEPLGISRPLSAPTIATASATTGGYVRSVAIINGGAGYSTVPTVTFSGGGLTAGDPAHATGRARVMNARVVGMTLDSRGSKYTSAPVITFSGGLGVGATVNVGVSGRLRSVEISNPGSGYTSAGSSAVAATVSGGGLTGAAVSVSVDANGGIASVNVLAAGTGATTTPTITLTGAGTGASFVPRMGYTVASLTCASTAAGTQFLAPPSISFRPDTGGAIALPKVTSTGGLQSPIEILAGGEYDAPPVAVINDTTAKAIAMIDSPMRGVYKCCIRYIDDTTKAMQGPIPSSISDFVVVSAAPDTTTFAWQWSNNGAESRVHQIELWRTTSDQSVMLYRVATLSKTDGVLPTSYTDTLTDDQLLNMEREGFGMMPIVMPSGQLNARRFNPPPTYCSQAVMFQDRAWYSVDTRKEKPNSLWHSEIDEPESVPEEYEIVVQESLGEPDAIVALIPMGSTLLIAQSRHLYKMTYVAQPLLDASIRLADSRGILNAKCYAILGGVAYIADGEGLYSYDGDARQDVSVAVDDYWRDGKIDFSKKDTFYVSVSPGEKVVRFFYCRSGDGDRPKRALCYCVTTQAWWEEVYAQELPSAAIVFRAGRPTPVHGGQAGSFVIQSGTALDATTAGTTGIPYAFRTGALPLTNEPSRAIGVLYKPTTDSSDLTVQLHYNASETPRDNAVYANRGEGFVQTTSGAVLDLKATRSALGVSPGYAQARYAGRADDMSAGADRHVAVAITGVRAVTEPIVIRGLKVDGVAG
jgi:hypothetical protein